MNGERCYSCGETIRDEYPSHLCAPCRYALTQPHPTFEERLTAADKKMLAAMLIGY